VLNSSLTRRLQYIARLARIVGEPPDETMTGRAGTEDGRPRPLSELESEGDRLGSAIDTLLESDTTQLGTLYRVERELPPG
jgi:hypothetical protein